MNEIHILSDRATLTFRGNLKIKGIDPDRVEYVIRRFFDPDIGYVYEAEHLPTGEKGHSTNGPLHALADTGRMPE